MTGRALTGGCLCGEVRWEASAPPANVRLCHCRLCQRATGGPYFARAVFRAEDIVLAGETTRWGSSDRLERRSCARCGTPMFAEPKDVPPRMGVALASLDEPHLLQPEAHIWVSRKLPWVLIDDGLPQYAEGI